jgi:hypothetical protein
MLEQVLRHLNNWFLVDIHEGTFTVENGSIALPFLLTNQYFRICGSVFNDGLHLYPAVDLTDEVFTGTVWALAVPKAVVSLSEDIDAWQEKNGEAVLSPYTSESFGGYSYTKASGGTGGTSAITGWQDAFRGRLNDWRRIGGI